MDASKANTVNKDHPKMALTSTRKENTLPSINNVRDLN